MSRIVYIIPGCGHTGKESPYGEIAEFFRKKRIRPIPIMITWKYKTMSDYIIQFLSQCRHSDNDEVYLFGFSFGAMIALISSQHVNPKLRILCSLSPYFKEDLPAMKPWWKRGAGKRRLHDFSAYSFHAFSRHTYRTILLVGSEELKEPAIKRRILDARNRLRQCEYIVVNGADHNLFQEEYLSALKRQLQKL